jgi:hypothetical protein
MEFSPGLLSRSLIWLLSICFLSFFFFLFLLRCCGRKWVPCPCWASTVTLEPCPVLFSSYILDILEDCVPPICIETMLLFWNQLKAANVFETACNMKVFPSHIPFNQILCKVWCSLVNRASAYIYHHLYCLSEFSIRPLHRLWIEVIVFIFISLAIVLQPNFLYILFGDNFRVTEKLKKWR